MIEADYDDLARWLSEIESTTSPAGFHGQIAGIWCRQNALPADLALDEIDAQSPAFTDLQQFAQSVQAALEASDCGFEPLLPPDTAPLPDRVEALADYSAGLLFGLALSGELAGDVASEDVTELMRDLTEVCKVSLDDEDEAAEVAYAELVEFLKVATQTLYVELHSTAA